MKSFKATGSIGDGLTPVLHKSAPQVALFSARGPNIKDYSFQDADLLKPDILAPGSLIWAAWSINGTDEANYIGKCFTDTIEHRSPFRSLITVLSFKIISKLLFIPVVEQICRIFTEIKYLIFRMKG